MWLPTESIWFNMQLPHGLYSPQPNWRLNADTNMSHAFGIFMARISALPASRSGTG